MQKKYIQVDHTAHNLAKICIKLVKWPKMAKIYENK